MTEIANQIQTITSGGSLSIQGNINPVSVCGVIVRIYSTVTKVANAAGILRDSSASSMIALVYLIVSQSRILDFGIGTGV